MNYYIANWERGRVRYLKQPSLIGAQVNNPLVPVVFRPVQWATTKATALAFEKEHYAEVERRILQAEKPELNLVIESGDEEEGQ
jgi:hypothetical protein